jgi:hypothetical protein
VSKRTKWLLGIGVIAALVIGWQVAAFAVHDTGAFELDGNATNAAATPGDDWDNVCHKVDPTSCPNPSDPTGASAVSWTAEPDPSASIFTGGGSKDPQDISNWAWKDAGGLPDKDNLLHSFAARYPSTPKGDVLFFGSDRFDNSGDAQQGFWFFQNKVTLGNTPKNGGSNFNGLHKNGDLLVVSDFSNGGTTSTITVYKWDTTCTKATGSTAGTCGDANLRILATSNSASCASAAANDDFCGIVNPPTTPNPPGTTPSPWPFLDKSGNTNFLNGEFYEGGVNLTKLGLGDECFSSVASETRSSTSTTATLKDFVLGGFGSCNSGVTTTPKDKDGNNIPADGLSIGTGSVQVKDSATVAVTGTTTWSGSVKFSLCGPLPASATGCATGGTTIGSAKTVSNTTTTALSDAATVTSAGKYCWRGDFTSGTTGVPNGSDSSATECFTVNPVSPTLDTQAVASSVEFGNPVQDNATLSGTATQPGTPVINPTTAGAKAGGTIKFTLLKANCTDLATGTGTNPQTVNVDGDSPSGDPYGPVSFTPDAPGTYHWKAEYIPATGDPNNLGSTHNGNCDDTDETVVVSQQNSTVQTEQNWVPNDTATLNHGGPAGYTVKFTLLKNVTDTECNAATPPAGSVIYTADRPVSASGSTFTASSNNTTAVTSVTSPGGDTYTWKIEVPATGSFKAVTSCVEATQFSSLTNGGTVTSP